MYIVHNKSSVENLSCIRPNEKWQPNTKSKAMVFDFHFQLWDEF